MKRMFYRVALIATSLVAMAAAKSDRMAYEVMPINRYGQTGLWNTHSARTLGMGRLAFNIYADFTSHEDYIVGITGTKNGTDSIDVVPNYNTSNMNFAFGYGITRFLDVSLSMPLAFDWLASTELQGFSDNKVIVGAGDLEIGLTFQYPPYPHRKFFEMAYYGALSIPTGNTANSYFGHNSYYMDKNDPTERYNRHFTSGSPEIEMDMLWTWDFREVADYFPVLFHVNYGLRWTVNYDNEHIFKLGGALEVRPADWVSIFGEFSAEPRFGSVQKDSTWEGKRNLKYDPLRIGPGVTFLTPIGFTVSAGAMFSLANSSGVKYSNISSHNKDNGGTDAVKIETAVEPKAKFVASIGWNGFVLPQDYDNDGIKDNMDNCPREAEDFDGFNDADGCPEVDNDNDGVADSLDKCMNEPEDLDGFEDEDGCPDLDNDEDGIPDLDDKCPSAAEDLDAFEDEDGCPEDDNDNDGILDSLDACPDKAEDKDGFNDEDGCPDIDNDQDGILDSLDKCRDEAETFNTFEDQDGCPDTKPVEKVNIATEIPRGKVVLRGVNFTSGKAVLTNESYNILDDVVASLREWPEIKIEVSGHTDSVGSERSNKRLSYNRAKAVMNYFLQQGVDASRIRSVGMGEEVPVADNSTADGRALNRRVELKRID